MDRIFFVLVCIFTSIIGSYSISLSKNETVIYSYHPCDVPFINFVQINDSNWMGYLHFELYPQLEEALLQIHFEKEVTITPISNNSSISYRYDKKNLMLYSEQPISEPYTFNVYTGSQKKNNPVVQTLIFNNEILCSSMKRKQSIESLDVTKPYNCGRKSIYHAEHLSLRTEAKAGDWPWHVAIFYRKGSEVIYQCGGSIVSSTAILTAAHCIVPGIPEKDYIVVAGIGSTNITDRDLDMLKLSVRKIIIHPKYKEMYSTADLAIIKVKTIAFTVHVQPVCIWGPDRNRKDLFGIEAVIVGFGENEHGTLNKDLRAINIMVQEDRTCGSLKGLLGKYTFCAGNGPDSITNVRNGDSGGGLLVRTSQPDHRYSWFIRGVLSKCGTSTTYGRYKQPQPCNPRKYVIFTDVAPHYYWINRNAGLLNPRL